MNRRWLCNDVWMDILPFFDRPQLGLKVAVLSPRFNALVNMHFDGKKELTLWRSIVITKNNGTGTATPELRMFIDANSMSFPLPDAHSPPMPNNICFRDLQINYIDHAVIAFLRANQLIFSKGTNLRLSVPHVSYNTDDVQSIWNDFARQIWPTFAPTIRHFWFLHGHILDTLLRLVSPTILTDDQINIHSINSGRQFPEPIGDDHFEGPTTAKFDRSTPNSGGSITTSVAAGQALSKWLHISRKDGQPKELRFDHFANPPNIEWQNNFKEKFLRATTSVSYKIFFKTAYASIEPFELVNERTQEKLRLVLPNQRIFGNEWVMRRCPIGETAAPIHWEVENLDDNLNTVYFWRYPGFMCSGLSETSSSEDEEAGQSSDNGTSSEEEAGQSSENEASSDNE